MSFQPFTVKYVIRAKFGVEGVVEKPDVIGAVFGQTEGLFGTELDLRELQKSGRIARIEIDLRSEKDKTDGSIIIPTSLDRVSTAIIAASIESIDRIGPCQAIVNLVKIDDVRETKRKAIIERAKEILHHLSKLGTEALKLAHEGARGLHQHVDEARKRDAEQKDPTRGESQKRDEK